jgi:hypothetical protein
MPTSSLVVVSVWFLEPWRRLGLVLGAVAVVSQGEMLRPMTEFFTRGGSCREVQVQYLLVK